jgi:hypothetical protein
MCMKDIISKASGECAVAMNATRFICVFYEYIILILYENCLL